LEIPAHGGAYVTTLPPGAAVWLDGTYLGQTPFYAELPPGHHEVTLTSQGWVAQSADFSLTVGRTQALSFLLQRPTSAKAVPPSVAADEGKLSVRGGPAGAVVYVDAVRAGAMPLERRSVASGNHIVVVGDDRAHRIMRDIAVYPNTLSVLALNLAPGRPEARDSEDMLAPLKAYVSPENVNISGQEIIVHTRGMELACEIGSHTYVLNGKAAFTSVTPAMLGGKVYLPLSLLKRIKD